MRVLIVEHNEDLARIWARFLARQGVDCTVATNQAEAFEALRTVTFGAIVLDMELPEAEAFEVSDFATYRDPDLPIIAVNPRSFFTDAAVFELIPNARGILKTPARPEDMAALVEHYGNRHDRDRPAAASAG